MSNLKFIKELRKARKLSQLDVAKYLNVSRRSYQYYENGDIEMPDSDLRKLADFYKVGFEVLKEEPDSINEIFKKQISSDLSSLTPEQIQAVIGIVHQFAKDNTKK
jgi:transcriptional regulator with XRE-family HTH domain